MAFAASTIIAAVGVGVAGVGLYQNYTNSQKASNAQAAAAKNQAEIAHLQAGNVEVQKQQLDLQSDQQLLQNQTQRAVIQDQAKADAIRMQAAELDATRRTRESVRAGIVARANALTSATASGATQPGSTAIAQVGANIAGQTNTNITGVSQQLDVGEKLYGINKDITAQYLNASYKNDAFVAKSKSLQTEVLDTQRKIYQLGGEASSNYATAAIAQGNAALGQGLTSLGGAIMNNSSTLGKMTNYFTSGGVGSSTYNNNSTAQPGDLNYYG
jgi:hypothetical protein